MVFSSHFFLFYFLPGCLLLYALSAGRQRHLTLTLLSYFFYGWANPVFVPVMLFSTAVDYACGIYIGRARDVRLASNGSGSAAGREKITLAVSIVTNLALLGFFKYFNFGVDGWNQIVAAFGWEGAGWDTALRVTLPLGISFYTFQSMSYTIDVYRGVVAPQRNFIDYACYVSMFPQLVAGPIIRYSDIAHQLTDRTHTLEKFSRGVAVFSIGLSKKILLANPCGAVADAAFDAGSVQTLDAWYGMFAYSFQIYFDFSAYSDMAIGLGLMMGFVFPRNFNAPYRSASITEFWRRWHISLSTWLRDYLYIPLGGSRRGPGRTYCNLFIVMLLGGLWHGAAWTFVIWGAVHGVCLAVERLIGAKRLARAVPRPLGVAVTFVIVALAWVFFRADNLTHALGYISCLFGAGEVQAGAPLLHAIIYSPVAWAGMTAAALITFFGRTAWDWTLVLTPGKAVTCIVLFIGSLLVLETQSYNPFIYFIF